MVYSLILRHFFVTWGLVVFAHIFPFLPGTVSISTLVRSDVRRIPNCYLPKVVISCKSSKQLNLEFRLFKRQTFISSDVSLCNAKGLYRRTQVTHSIIASYPYTILLVSLNMLFSAIDI